MVDCSKRGIGLESDYFVPPQSVVLVRSPKAQERLKIIENKEICILTVQWCKKREKQARKTFSFGGQLLSDPRWQELLIPGYLQYQDLKSCQWSDTIRQLQNLSQKDISLSDSLLNAKEAAEARAKHLGIINRFAAIISSTLELNEILQTICTEMVEIFQTRNAGIGLLDSDEEFLRVVAFQSRDPNETDATGMKISLKDYSAARFVIENRQTIIVPDVQHNPLTSSYHNLAAKRGTECLMIVPLMTKEQVIGTIGLPASQEKPEFTPEEVLLGQTIASQISGAIENAELYKKTLIAKNLAEKELEIGRQIQSSFFPESLPACPGWEFEAHFTPAHQVSGDFYDVIQLTTRDRVGLVIGDVCDKGVGAALFMALFRSLIRAFVMQGGGCGFGSSEKMPLDDHELLMETARSVHNYITDVHSNSGMFATLFIGLLELQSGKLVYVNCGHEAPIIRDGKRVRTWLNPTSPAIGVCSQISVSTNQEMLHPGEMLLAFTDGITEAQNTSGELFTRDRVANMMKSLPDTAAAAISKIMSSINRYVGETDPMDDITIISVKRL